MTGDTERSIHDDIAAYYTEKLDLHGLTPQGVDWNGADSHERRHQQFDRLFEGDRTASVIDLGCGFGDYLRHLRASGHTGRFIGYDIAANMIDAARKLHGESDDRQWRVGAEPTETADYAIASGILNVKNDVSLADWAHYVERTVALLARVSKRGFAFNVLSLSSDPERRRPYLQDYGLYEFTMIVRKPAAT